MVILAISEYSQSQVARKGWGGDKGEDCPYIAKAKKTNPLYL